MKKIKILRNVLNFISLTRKTTKETESFKEVYSPNTLAVKQIMDPNNVNLPELNFEEFEKIKDFSISNQHKSIYNNQMSLLSADSSLGLNSSPQDSFKQPNETPSKNEFKIKILPLSDFGELPTNNKNYSSRSKTISMNSNNERSPKRASLNKIIQTRDGDGCVKNFQGEIVTEKQKENENENEGSYNKSQSSESRSQDEEESEEDSIDIIEEEEEDQEEDDYAEETSPKTTTNDKNNNNLETNNPNLPSELMPANGENNAEVDNGAVHDEIVEEIETLEEELNPHMDVNLMLDAYEDNKNMNNQRLRKKKEYKDYQLILYPDDNIKSTWSLLLTLILGYTCLVTPYRVAFISNDENSDAWDIIDWVTDSVFWFDIFVNFISAYYDKNDNLIVSKKNIVYNYFKGWLIPDIVGVLPFDFFFQVSRYGNLVRVAKLPKLYKLMRLTKIIRVLKLIKERNTIIKYLMDFLSIGLGFERLFVSICSILVFCHLACCFWYLAATINDDPVNWVQYYNFEDKANFEIYIASFYWITQTVVTVGYGDIAAVNTLERSIACVYMFVGVFFYSFTIGSLSSLLSSLDSKNATFDQKLNTLIQIRNQYNLDNFLYNRVKRALKYGTTQKDDEKIDFLNELPLNLKIELSVIMYKNVVAGIEFFRNKPATFIALIGPYLKPFHIGKEEFIFYEGEYADEMYFIKTGSVSMVLKEHNNFEFMTIDKGYYFGEVDLLFGETRKYNYIAGTDLELLALSKKDFNKIFFYEFREIGSEIYKNAIKRRIRANKIQKDALEFCQKHSEKKKSSQKNSFYCFKPQLSLAKKSTSHRESESIFNKISSKQNDSLFFGHNNNSKENNFIETPQQQEIKETEKKAQLLKAIIEENNPTHTLLPNEQKLESPIESYSAMDKNLLKPNSGLTKFKNLFAKSNYAKKSLGLENIFSAEEGEQKDVVAEGLKQMNLMENKMKNIETNMDEIFQFYKSLGIEMEKPEEKENLKLKQKLLNKNSLEKEENEKREEIKKETFVENKNNMDREIKSSGLKAKKPLGIFKSFKNKKL